MAIYKWRNDGVTSRVAYRPLKTDYNDYSGNGYHLTATGGVSLVTIDGVQCAYGGNGTVSDALYSQTVPMPSGNSPRTFCFWYKPNNVTYNGYVLSYGGTSRYTDFSVQDSVRQQSSSADVSWTDGNAYFSSSNLWGSWANVVVTYDGTDAKMYINGTLEGTSTTAMDTTAVSSTRPFHLFNTKTTYNVGSRGYLSEVIVENVAWTQQQVQNYYNQTKDDYVYNRTPGANTLSYLPLTAETKLTDYGTLGWTWTTYGTEGTGWEWGTNYWETKGNSTIARLYTGPNTYSIYSVFTESIWVKMNNTFGDVVVVNNYGSGDNGNVTLHYNRVNFYSPSRDLNMTSISDGAWHLVTVTRGNDGEKLYRDGVLASSSQNTATMRPAYAILNSPRAGSGNSSWGGAMCFSSFIIEDKERTAQEISDYYNNTKGNYGIS